MSTEQPEIVPPNKKYTNHGLVGSVKKLYLDEKSSDIKFLFGSDDDDASTDTISGGVVAHKNLLAAASDVFDAMFYGDLKEKGDIRLTDSSKAPFMEFLQFFYLNEVELTEENIGGVLYLGQKYNVTACIAVCNQFLMDLLTIDNIFVILDLATAYDQYELIKFCEKFIILNTTAVLKSASFLECDKKVLAHILGMDNLTCSEVELFEACMSWVKSKSGQEVVSSEAVETHFDELFYKIRFASMTMTDLHNLTEKYESVLQRDFFTISKIINMPEYQSEDFNTSPRHQIEWNADAAIECSFKNGLERPYNMLKRQPTTFTVNEPLLLGGFTCGKIESKGFVSLMFNLNSTLSADVEIFESRNSNGGNANLLLKMKVNLQSTDTKVILPRPLLIQPGVFYRIILGPIPNYQNYHFHSGLLKTEVKIQSNITIKLQNSSIAVCPKDASRHGKMVGLIWALNFNTI